MSILRNLGALAVTPALATAALAQFPGAPVPSPLPNPSPIPTASPSPTQQAISAITSAPIPGIGDPIGIAPYPPPPGSGGTLAGFLGLSNQQIEYRQRAMARTPMGELRSKIQTPLSKITGGLIPPFPPETPSLAELQAPGPVGAAAKVKLDRAAAKDRIKAVQYLGTVDCHYWPEATDGLVDALRKDRNEWVRLAAAQTLAKGCCCNKKTIEALSIVVSCSNSDGDPIEKSPRVIAAAHAALARCVGMCCASPAIMAPVIDGGGGQQEGGGGGERPNPVPGNGVSSSKPGPGGMEKSSGGLPAAHVARPTGKEYYNRVAERPWAQVLGHAKDVLARAPQIPAELLLTGAGTDLETSEVTTAFAQGTSDRRANLLDHLLGDDKPAVPVPTVALVPVGTIQTATVTQPAPAVAAKPVQPAPVVAVKPAPAPTAPAVTVTVAPTAIPTTAVQQQQPAPIVPAVPVAKPTPAPAKAVAAAPAVSPIQLVSMLGNPDDPRRTEAFVDALTAQDVAGNPTLAPALLKAAEQHKDSAVRCACVRALVRGKMNDPATVAGLERLVNDRAIDVRVEAAVGVNELKAGK